LDFKIQASWRVLKRETGEIIYEKEYYEK